MSVGVDTERRDHIAYESGSYLWVDGFHPFDPRTGDAADPTGLPVFVAFVPTSVGPIPADGDAAWKAAEWTPGQVDSVRYLLEPHTIDLDRGQWYVAIRVDGTVELIREVLPDPIRVT